jgi:wobble nucleotide-excising tRNase
MIVKIKKIKNLGIFSNYTWDSDLPGFLRYNVLYGWNGSGKTTLSKLFSYLETGSSVSHPDLEYEIESEDGNCKHGSSFNRKIRVFNHDYVENNVQLLGGKANPIFILGEENKEIAEQIEADEESLQVLERLKQTKEEEKEIKETEKGKSFTNVASVIGANLVGSSTRNYRKPDAERDFVALTNPKVLSEDEFAHHRDVVKQEQKEKISLIEPNIVFDLSALYEEVSKICAETVEVNVIEELADHPEVSRWVEDGLKFHNHDSQNCEFCGSTIPTGRLNALLGHFNEADKRLKEKIESKVQGLRNVIQIVEGVQLPNKAQFYSDLQTPFTSKAMSFSQEKDNFCKELAVIVDVLESKKQKTTEVVPFARSLTNSFEAVINSVNEVVAQHNQKTDNFQTKKDEAVEVIKQHHLSEIYEEVKRLEAEIKECSNEITTLIDGSDGTPEALGIKALRLRIGENKSKISSEHKACDSLNKQLSTFLGRDEIRFEVAPEGGYHIKRNGVVAKNLSEGEKTAVAFVYFVVQLNDRDFDINEGIVVIDDPVSSLDSNSLFQAFAFLKNAVKGAKQVFLFTHNFAFLKLLLN